MLARTPQRPRTPDSSASAFDRGDKVRWKADKGPSGLIKGDGGTVVDTPRNGSTVYVDWGGNIGRIPVAAGALEKVDCS